MPHGIVCPISLDVGTNNDGVAWITRNTLGWRHRRLTGSEYVKFIQQFARAFKNVFPHALCQWEDFSKQNAFAVRDAYLHDLISFNDDIQGTGAVTLAAIFAAMKIKGEKIEDQVLSGPWSWCRWHWYCRTDRSSPD